MSPLELVSIFRFLDQFCRHDVGDRWWDTAVSGIILVHNSVSLGTIDRGSTPLTPRISDGIWT
jgi:hypothetical protein